MGLRGPAKKATALNRADGNPSRRPMNDAEPLFAEGEPEMPPGMSEAAQEIWKETVPILLNVPNLLTVADGAVLSDYCIVRARKADIMARMRSHEHAIDVLTRGLEAERAAAFIKDAVAKGKTLSQEEADAMAMAAMAQKADDKLTSLQTLVRREEEQINKLLHRENVLRREIGLSASARTSIRVSGASRDPQGAVDEAMFGHHDQLVDLSDLSVQ